MTTFTIIALLAVSLSLLAWIACLLRHDAKQESFINHLVSRILEEEEKVDDLEYSVSCLEIMHGNSLEHAHELAEELYRTKENLVPWIDQLQGEVLDLEDKVRDLDNLKYENQAEIDHLKFQMNLAKEALDNLETRVYKKELSLPEISYDLGRASTILSPDEIPF